MHGREIKFARFLLVFLLMFSWLFSGWPEIWENPRVPPKIPEAHAAVTYSTDCDGTIQTTASAVAISACDVGTGLTDAILIISVFGDDGGGTHGTPTVTRGTGSTCGTGTETATIIDTEVSNGDASVSTYRLLDANFAEGSADVCVSWASSDPPDEWSAHITVFTLVEQSAFTSATASATFGDVDAITQTITIAANEHGYQANSCNTNASVTTLNTQDTERFILVTGGADKSAAHVSTQTATGSPATMGVDLYSKTCVVAAMKLITLNDAAVSNAAPTVAGVVLKKTDNSIPIVLIENTTTSVSVVGIITDLDGDADITSATATIYLTSVANAEACSASDINCYVITSGNCALEATDADNDRAVTCTTALWFLAERSDDDGETWTGFISTRDVAGDFGTGTAIEEVATLQALDVTANLSYGSLSPLATTSIANQLTMQVTTTGNEAIDVTLQASNDMCDTADCSGNQLAACQQQYSTNTAIEYEDSGDSFAEAIEVSSTTARNLALESVTPTTHTGDTSDEADEVFWKMGIPTGQALATYNGTTTIISKADAGVSDIGDIAQCN